VPSILAKSEPYDFSQSYNPTVCPPQVAANLAEIQNLRNNFYMQFKNIQGASDHQLIEN